MDVSYIPDGYTRPGYIEAIPGLHGALGFVFRPMLAHERSIVLESIEKAGRNKSDRLAASTIAHRIVSWDLKHPVSGGEIQVSEPEAIRLHPILLSRLFNIVLGNMASDINPDWDDETKTDLDDEAFQRALDGTLSIEAEQVKN